MMEWRDQVAVVTGGARGLGRATARLLAQHGAAVCVNYAAHADVAEALIAEIAAAGGRAIAVAADIAEAASVEAIVARTEAELGPVTILVNNAGVAWQGTLDTYDREQVARMRQVNVEGVIHATDVANAVVFLASSESGWITAQTLTVDGGRMDYIGHG
jgi:NAD(P)-dependent dehydrogenase (short-subunit alcohol dehydrogenase family)